MPFELFYTVDTILHENKTAVVVLIVVKVDYTDLAYIIFLLTFKRKIRGPTA